MVAAFVGLGSWSLALLPLWYLLRAAKAARAKRGDLPFPVWRPDLLLGASGVLVVIDIATWAGAIRWLLDAFRGRK